MAAILPCRANTTIGTCVPVVWSAVAQPPCNTVCGYNRKFRRHFVAIMKPTQNKRELEQGMELDLQGRMTYGGYLHLDTLLSAQRPLSDPPHHDEMLFIIQHQTSELWMKLMIHELQGAVARLRADDLPMCQKILARAKRILEQLTSQWSVLETLTPSEYLCFRPILGPSSGFQSLQYRLMEFSLGNKNADMLKVFAHDSDAADQLRAALAAPSLYDEALQWLSRHGHAIPAHRLDRDWSQAPGDDEELVAVFARIYASPQDDWPAYQLCEDLVDLETQFQHWRSRHLRAVMRIIGYKRGTGGSSGVSFLKQALDLSFFPELFHARTQLDD